MKLQNIKLNEKYTILSSSNDYLSCAMCKVIKCTIKDIQIVQYAQHSNAIQIRYREFRKRKDHILTILNHDDLVVLNGYHDIVKKYEIPCGENSFKLIPNDPTKYFDHKDLVYKKEVNEVLEVYKNYESIIDASFDYLVEKRFNEGLRGEAAKDEGYYKTLKDFIFNCGYSINDEMIDYFKNNDYDYIVEDIKKVRFTLFDLN